MKNLIQRAITGILFVGIIIGAILLSDIIATLVFAAIMALTILEFTSLVYNEEEINIGRLIAPIAGFVLYMTPSLWDVFYPPFMLAPVGIYLLSCFAAVISELYAKDTNHLQNWAYFFLSQIYIAVPFALLNVMNTFFSPVFLIALFVLIWAYDSGAYVFGMMLGKHRLFERISPKKSWEGAIGGFLTACIAALIFAHFSPSLHVAGWLGFAVLVTIFGTFGDLTESLLKRTLHIKDSGNILPGHGGLLDRFDSLLFATPVIVLYLMLLLGKIT